VCALPYRPTRAAGLLLTQEKAANVEKLRLARAAEDAKARPRGCTHSHPARTRGSCQRSVDWAAPASARCLAPAPPRLPPRFCFSVLCFMRPQVYTFRPAAVKPAPARASASAAVVKGMDAFAARQADARKRRAEAEAAAAEAEAALSQARARCPRARCMRIRIRISHRTPDTRARISPHIPTPSQPTAVPFAVFNAWKPFAAADPSRAAERAANLKKAAAELEAKRAAECTFRPTFKAARPNTPAGGGTPSKAAAPPAATVVEAQVSGLEE
jgi:hypothetical protein